MLILVDAYAQFRLGVLSLLNFPSCCVCMRKNDCRCRVRFTLTKLPLRAHVAFVPGLRQRQSFLSMLLSQQPKTMRVASAPLSIVFATCCVHCSNARMGMLALCTVLMYFYPPSMIARCHALATQESRDIRSGVTARCLSFHPRAQCVMHALKGLACRASPSRAR